MFAHATRVLPALFLCLPQTALASARQATDDAPTDAVDTVAAVETFELTVGDEAPELRVSAWLRGSAIPAFERGTVYVVEFWATWCGPCLQAIPRLDRLQARYDERLAEQAAAPGSSAEATTPVGVPRRVPVRFIGISIWEDEPDAAAAFVGRMQEGMNYTVAADLVDEAHPEGVCAEHWMDAAGQAQIPTAFIVDADGRIAWIGHPVELERPLERIVAGDWNLTVAAAEHARRMTLVLARRRLGQQLAELSSAGKWNEAVQVVETSLVDHPGLELELGLHKYDLLARGGKQAECKAYGARLVDVVFKTEPGQLGALAWSIADPRSEAAWRDLALARRAAERANELTGWNDASLVETLAVVVFEQGDRKKAIQLQEKAVRLAEGTPLEGELARRLERFRNEEEGGA